MKLNLKFYSIFSSITFSYWLNLLVVLFFILMKTFEAYVNGIFCIAEYLLL